MSLIPALGRQRQADLCEFEVSLAYRMSSRTGSKATEKRCLEKTNKNGIQQLWLCYVHPVFLTPSTGLLEVRVAVSGLTTLS